MAKFKSHILICGGTGCQSSNSEAIFNNLERELATKGLIGNSHRLFRLL